MEQISNEIRIGYSDHDINAILDRIGDDAPTFTRHFSQSEEFFLKLEKEYTVPRIPIHHDVRLLKPSPEYLATLRGVMEQVAGLAPQVLKDLSYFFDPAEILRPCFFKIYKVEDSFYLYLLRLDLLMKPSDSVVIERGTNDMTPVWRSRKLFLENSIIPLEEVVRNEGRVKSLRLKQTVSQTWIGEFGRGYFQQGIWMDMDLTRFFSRLFLPADKRTYPYFPYLCKYKTVCQSVINLSVQGRKSTLPYLHRAIQFLLPVMDAVQSAMKSASFSEDMGFYKELKAKVPPAWYEPWRNLKLEGYLNEADMKEFRVED